MTETTTDKATGLPLLGVDNRKTLVIPLNLVPELRTLEEQKSKSEEASRVVGQQLVMITATAAAVGQAAFKDHQAWQAMVMKIAALSNIPPEAVQGTDLDKGVLLLK